MLSIKSLAFVKKLPFWYVYIAGIVTLLVSLSVWFVRVSMSPERVFWGMIENSLSTSGVTVEIEQTAGQNKIKQIVQTQTGITPRVRSVTRLVNGSTKVKTEVIGTPTADYTRYHVIETDQKNAEGKPLDVKKVIDVWARGDELVPGQSARSGLVVQTILGVGLPLGSVPVPIGAVQAQQRSGLMDFVRTGSVYEVSFANKDVTKARKAGRLEYTYDVRIQTIPYARFMQLFAKAIGMTELDGIDPNSFASGSPVNARFTVDAYARKLVSVQLGESYRQNYSSHGLRLDAQVPAKFVGAAELQQLVNDL